MPCALTKENNQSFRKQIYHRFRDGVRVQLLLIYFFMTLRSSLTPPSQSLLRETLYYQVLAFLL